MIRTKDKKIVEDNLRKVAKAINKQGFKVGEIYTADQRKKWINEVLEPEPKRSIIRRRSGQTEQRISVMDRKTLIPKDCTLNIPQEKVNLIYKELQELKIDKYRNAVAVLFRVFLELSAKHFIKSRTLEDVTPLYKKIQTIGKYMKQKKILTEDELNPVYTATSKTVRSIFSTKTFNDYAHSLEYIPNSNDLKIAWTTMQKFIEKLWE